MPHPPPVTNDVQVLGIMQEKKARSSAKIANALGLTPFQITARLKSMEKRGLVARTESGKWYRLLTPEQAKAVQPAPKAGGTSSPRLTLVVKDDKVPRIRSCAGWARQFKFVGDTRMLIVADPADGQRYVQASPHEEAHLVFESDGLPPYRLRRLETSTFYRRMEKRDEVDAGRAVSKKQKKKRIA
jgi:hypothetical protein